MVSVEEVLMAKKTRKIEAANVSVLLYGGEWQASYDCIGADECAHVRYHVEPPDPEDDCAFLKYGGTCTCGIAQKSALEKLRDRITQELGDI